MRILVVSSTAESETQTVSAARLAFRSAEIQSFLDPLMAVKQNQDKSADLVLCEFSLRIIDGIQLIKLLRQQNRGIVPVLLEPDEGHGRDAENLGIPHLPGPEPAALRSAWENETEGKR